MLSDPTSTDTSTPTRAAFREHGILGALLDSLLHPLPYGANGDSEGDVDFEEKAMW
jgi:hsp70-interacting protein